MYETLFADLIALLQAEFGATLLGVLASGSRIHGTPSATSDLDSHVLISSPRRRRRNFLLHGLEIEMFINPPQRIPAYFNDGRPVTLHMFAFGQAIYDPQGIVADLQAQARTLWNAGPPLIPPSLDWHHRYVAADLTNDLLDLGDDDDSSANLLIGKLVEHLLATHYGLQRRWLAKPKRLLTDLASWDDHATTFARAALESRPLNERRAAINQLAAHVLAPIGGLAGPEWTMDWEEL